jgi:hypothetical protein
MPKLERRKMAVCEVVEVRNSADAVGLAAGVVFSLAVVGAYKALSRLLD